MSLLQLDPATQRLRRIARAYAAGELSQDEFRRIRAEVIANFCAEPLPEKPDPDATEATQRASSTERPGAQLACT